MKDISDWTKYNKLNMESNGKHIIYVKITDEAENIEYISSNGFTLNIIENPPTGDNIIFYIISGIIFLIGLYILLPKCKIKY